MKGIIYKITNKVNGMSYIGQTRYTVEFRWKQHQHKKDNTYFHNAIKKYGVDNFQVEILEECEYKDLDSKEIFYISKYNTFEKGYNLTIGGDGRRKIISDNQYEEISELYLSGFSSNKIATLYDVDKATILKILHIQGIKLRSNTLNINKQELQELISDYKSGFSLKELAKRYNCCSKTLKDFLIKKGVDLREKYSVLKDYEKQELIVNEYLKGKTYSYIKTNFNVSESTIKKILSLHGITTTKHHFKMNDKESLEAISLFNQGYKVQNIARHFGVDKCTIYSMFKRYHVNYLTV